MAKAFSVVILLALGGCSGISQARHTASACAGAEQS